MRIGLDVLQHLGLEQELGQAFLFDGVVLDHGDHVLLEVAADVAQPLGDTGRRRTESGGALTAFVFARGFVVNGGEGFVHAELFLGELAAARAAHLREGFLRVVTQNQPPALQLFFVRNGGHKGRRRS